jgi:hypothetical protein
MGLDLGSILTGAVTGIVSPVTDYFKRKRELAEQQHEADLKIAQATADRQAQLISQGLAADATWELESLKAGQGSRNFELYVLSAPLILCFTPYAYLVKEGFDAISKTPTWFQTLVVTVYLANYGIRLWRRQQSDT